MALTLLLLCHAFFGCGDSRQLPLGRIGFGFRAHDLSSTMTFLRKCGSLLAVLSKSCATAARNSFCSCDRSHRTNFATTTFKPRSSAKISETIVHGIPRFSSNSRTVNHQFSLTAVRTPSTFLGVLLAEGLPEHESLSMDSQPSLKHQYHNFIWASLIAHSRKPYHLNSFSG